MKTFRRLLSCFLALSTALTMTAGNLTSYADVVYDIPTDNMSYSEPADETPDGEPADEAPDGEPADEAPDGEPADEAPDGEPADETPDGEPADEAPDGEPGGDGTAEVPEEPKGSGNAMQLGGVFYESFEEAFKHLDKTAPNYIYLHEDIAPAKFTLPTGISELTIMSDGTTRTITLPKITSLAPSFKFCLDDVNIVSAGASSLTINARNDFNLNKVSFAPVTNISVAANHEIFMQGSISGIGKLSGSSTSKLTIYESTDVSEIANFDTVWIPATDPVKVSGKVSGINTMDGKLRMLSADKANTAVIKKAQGTLSLAYNNGAVTKATVTEVPGLLRVAVYDEGTNTLTKLPSGIPILTAGGTANLTDHLSIENKDSANHNLDA
ncbi:MAG: hypothetical protein J6X60_13610 [Ruminiclostridium sp.]|nr:hypothetical protein [Ruminiclostridium sp.]